MIEKSETLETALRNLQSQVKAINPEEIKNSISQVQKTVGERASKASVDAVSMQI